MASLIVIGHTDDGKVRRFATLPGGRFWYACPECAALAIQDQAWCTCGLDLRVVAGLYAK